MKSLNLDVRKKQFDTLLAVAEGLWNGMVVSGVLAISAVLIKKFWIF